MNIKNIAAVIFLIITAVEVQAQLLVLKDVNGKPIPVTKYVNVSGSPFLNDEWMQGEVQFENNSKIKDVNLKYDLVEDEIYFEEANKSMAFTMHVKEFKLYPPNNKEGFRHFVSGLPVIKGATAATFYEVLVTGNVQLLKRSRKTISETKDYSSATINKNIMESSQYYLFTSGQLISIKKDKKSIIAALPDKARELENYIKSNNLNLKQDADLSKLMVHYNVL